MIITNSSDLALTSKAKLLVTATDRNLLTPRLITTTLNGGKLLYTLQGALVTNNGTGFLVEGDHLFDVPPGCTNRLLRLPVMKVKDDAGLTIDGPVRTITIPSGRLLVGGYEQAYIEIEKHSTKAVIRGVTNIAAQVIQPVIAVDAAAGIVALPRIPAQAAVLGTAISIDGISWIN